MVSLPQVLLYPLLVYVPRAPLLGLAAEMRKRHEEGHPLKKKKLAREETNAWPCPAVCSAPRRRTIPPRLEALREPALPALSREGCQR